MSKSKKREPVSRAESKAETRRALIEAGIKAFAEEGLDGPSLDSICERAGKTRGAFYVHFTDRDDLLAAVMEQVLGIFAQAIIASGGGGGDLERTVRAFVALAKSPRGLPGSRVPLHQFHAACARNEGLRERYQAFMKATLHRMAEVIREAQCTGHARDDVPPETLATMLVTMVSGVYSLREQRVPVAVDALGNELLRLLAPLPSKQTR